MSRRLEEFRIFPIIAWVLVIGFAGFVFSLANKLTDASGISGDLEAYTSGTTQILEETSD